MKKIILLFSLILGISNVACTGENKKAASASDMASDTLSNKANENIAFDRYQTSEGELKLFVIGHVSLLIEFGGKMIYVDPYSNVSDYSKFPKADLILLTHDHSDHLDTSAIGEIKSSKTHFIVSKACSEILGYGEVVDNGDTTNFEAIRIEAVPAYNVVNKNPAGEFYHPKGRGNGYLLTFGDKKVYIAGDTENIPEMDVLKDSVYIAFLPKNLPYTMNDDMFVDAAKRVSPTYLYPYHFSEYNAENISEKLKDSKIELLVRPMATK